jgi:hypothetical protein
MAKITDPSDLSYVVNTTAGGSDEVEIQTGAKTIQLIAQGAASNASPAATSGITGKCLYSLLKEAWKDNSTLNKHRFPIQMIYEASFVWINGWGPADATTRDMIRDAGFQETDGRENACIISLGSMYESTDQGYYTNDFTSEFAETKVNFNHTGEINENIQIKGTGGSPDNTSYLKVFLREEQRTFASYDLLTEQGLSALKYEAYRLPLSNGDDSLKAIDNDTTITGDAGSESGVKYSELTIDYLKGSLFGAATDNIGTINVDEVLQDTAGRWYRCTSQGTIDATDAADLGTMGGAGTAVFESYPGERQIGSSYYAFNRILDVQDTTNSYKARLKEIHSWAQWKLRQSSDINDNVNTDAFGTVYGNIALPFTDFIGDTLHTKPGVFIDNYDTNDKNDIRMWDITVDPGDSSGGLDSEYAPKLTTEREFPFVAAGNINFSSNFVDEPDADTRYTMYFQYIRSDAVTNLKVSGTSGNNATLDWSADAGALDHLTSGDYIIVSGLTSETANNGIWSITGTPSSNTVTATKFDGTAPADDATGSAATVLENPFETPGATIVDNNSAADIDGQISAASIGFDFDYTNNNQEGRVANQDAPVYVVAIAYDGAQYVLASHTITKTTGQSIPVNAVDELNYENPA